MAGCGFGDLTKFVVLRVGIYYWCAGLDCARRLDYLY